LKGIVPNFHYFRDILLKMKISEILSELTFKGRPCTKDCSGHRAGYSWGLARNVTGNCTGNSQSFINGCEIASIKIKRDKKRR
jgi:hypothetical protein